MSRPAPTVAAFCLLLLGGMAQAEDLPPLVVPEGIAADAGSGQAAAVTPAPEAVAPSPEVAAPETPGADAPAVPADDATVAADAPAADPAAVDTPAAGTAPAVPPDLQPPAIDARVELALPSADFSNLGFSDRANGYRFIVSFRLENVTPGAWSIAPEIGYFRMGQSERTVVTLMPNTPSGFDTTRTDTFKLDASSLDFGVRFGRPLNERLEAFVRGGLAVTHVRHAQETLDHAEPKPGNTAAPYDTKLTTPAVTNVSIDPWIAGGVVLPLGEVPSVYAEYGLRTADGELAQTFTLGLLLNF